MRRAEELTSLLVAVPLAGAICAVSSWAFAPQVAFASCVLGWTMLAVAMIDARHFIVPDVLSLPMIPLGLLASGSLLDPSSDGLVAIDHVIGAVAGGAGLWLVRAAYFHLRRREGLGLGDVKLVTAAGAWVGWQQLSLVLLLAAASALSFIIAMALLRRSAPAGAAKIPFATFLAPSIWVAWALDVYSRSL